MEIVAFVETRRPRWLELERLLDKSEALGLQSLSVSEARQLCRLYRAASGDLLFVRARSAAAEVSEYLNDLVGRAYAVTYPGKKPRVSGAWTFVSRTFPRVLRRELPMFLAATLLFWAGAGFGYVGMLLDPDAAPYLVPDEHLKLDPVKRAEDAAKDDVASADRQAEFSSFLFTHNIGVAFFCFALGITAGVGTAIMLFANGLMLGALAQVYAAKGMIGWFWAWILPHGIPEITAICIAGAAGFVMARGLVAPRGLSRRVSLRAEATTAVQILLGTLLLFVLAGFIEGTISQIHPPHLSIAFKIGFALTVGLGVYAYLLSDFLRGGQAEEA
jgi:uncharacterized membrane protein SpoIIM required for sporulation